MSQKTYGASPDDWTLLSVVAGLTEDLLPVVSNPGARISPDSNLKSLGKVPSLYNAAGMAVGLSRWTEKQATGRDVDRWSAVPDLGICIQTRTVRALDVDIEDEAAAAKVKAVIDRHCEGLPVRFRADTGKFLTAFALPGEFTKRILRTAHGAIEFLATGQQFVAVGTHPKGTRYQWQDGTPDDFPTVSREAFEALWAELMSAFATEEVQEFTAGRQLKEVRRRVDVPDETADYLEEHGWVLSRTRDGRLNIRCPFEHEHSGPSADDTATQYLPKGVGGFEQGHFKCLHAHCAGRNDGEFIEAVGVVAAQFDVVEYEPEEGEVELPPFRRNDLGVIIANISNTILALRSPAWLGVDLARDEFRDELMISPYGKQSWRSFTDADYTRIRLQLAGKGLSASLELTKEAVNLRASENAFDSAILWLKDEVPAWDGVPRIEAFYPRVFGVEDTPYARAVGRYTWTALAGRVLDPGCKVDMVPILRGDQGLGKSRAVAAMAPSHEFFAELDLSERDDNMSRLMRGRLIAELGELKGLHSRDIEAVKAFITRRYENWVPKYKEFAVTFPRRLLFIGTTNRHEFLADDTGNRRWLPVEATRADADLVEAERLQLWAEARDTWRKTGVDWSGAQTLAQEHHEHYRIKDSWEEVISDWLDEFSALDEAEAPRHIQTRDVLVGALRFEPRSIKRGDEMRVAGVLTALGFTRKTLRVAGKNTKVWTM